MTEMIDSQTKKTIKKALTDYKPPQTAVLHRNETATQPLK